MTRERIQIHGHCRLTSSTMAHPSGRRSISAFASSGLTSPILNPSLPMKSKNSCGIVACMNRHLSMVITSSSRWKELRTPCQWLPAPADSLELNNSNRRAAFNLACSGHLSPANSVESKDGSLIGTFFLVLL